VFKNKNKNKNKNIQKVLKFIVMQVAFTGIQQSSIKSKKNLLPSKIHDIQVKDKL
jgi:hypothetical protein